MVCCLFQINIINANVPTCKVYNTADPNYTSKSSPATDNVGVNSDGVTLLTAFRGTLVESCLEHVTSV